MHRLLLALFLVPLLAGCLSDDGDGDGDGPESSSDPRVPPVTQGPDAIDEMEWVSQPSTNSTTGIWVEDGLAYLSGGVGLRIIDVHDPANPVVLASDVAETQGTRDVQAFVHPNGRHYAAMARGGS